MKIPDNVLLICFQRCFLSDPTFKIKQTCSYWTKQWAYGSIKSYEQFQILCGFSALNDANNNIKKDNLAAFNYAFSDMCLCYLIKLEELLPLFMCAAASNRGDVQHAVTEFNECPPVKNNMLVLSASRTGVGHHNQVYTSECCTTFLILLCAHFIKSTKS